eukprot:TRINITY_DN38605_c0_g1_i1.p1 TRINITY_DN38605_c0_g1~~TRINITY_DN38605_c0_g1_i1.p1  ORF type:complete len:191 (+),score=49.06 TRINITY_DN38605_c0_g1_i1:68-640(+)
MEERQEVQDAGVDSTPILHSPGRKRSRPASTEAAHVSWDEENLAEHDKLRGTRQKIDEPKTPFVHSPLDVSEDEAITDSPQAPRPTPDKAKTGTEGGLKFAVDPATLGARLQALAEDGPGAKQDGAAEPEESPSERKMVWTVATGPGKPSSASFKAKRAAHYNEFKVMQAMRKGESSGDETSDEEKTKKN